MKKFHVENRRTRAQKKKIQRDRAERKSTPLPFLPLFIRSKNALSPASFAVNVKKNFTACAVSFIFLPPGMAKFMPQLLRVVQRIVRHKIETFETFETIWNGGIKLKPYWNKIETFETKLKLLEQNWNLWDKIETIGTFRCAPSPPRKKPYSICGVGRSVCELLADSKLHFDRCILWLNLCWLCDYLCVKDIPS